MTAWDIVLFRIINQKWANPFFDIIMPLLSNANKSLWFWLPILCVIIYMLWNGPAKNRYFVLLLALSIGVSNELCDILKSLTHSLRPCMALPDIILRGDYHTSFGFPSAHSANMTALALTAALFFRRGWIAFILPLAIGYSRVYLGAHFPLQVLGGYATGALTAYIFFLIYRFLSRRKPKEEMDEPQNETVTG